MTKKFISPDDLADLLGISVRTIYSWRSRNLGPRGVRVGKHLRFDWGEVERWIESQTDPWPAAS